MKTYINIKIEADKVPLKVVSDLLAGRDVNLIVSENETDNVNAPKYAEKGVAVWIKESKY